MTTQADETNVSDEQIRERIHERLALEPGLPIGQLTITVGDGIVIINGEVPNQEVLGQLTELVQTVPAVKGLRSHLKVSGHS